MLIFLAISKRTAMETAKNERVLREVNKQFAYQYDELRRSEYEIACQQVLLLVSRRQEARAKEAAERRKVAAEGYR